MNLSKCPRDYFTVFRCDGAESRATVARVSFNDVRGSRDHDWFFSSEQFRNNAYTTTSADSRTFVEFGKTFTSYNCRRFLLLLTVELTGRNYILQGRRHVVAMERKTRECVSIVNAIHLRGQFISTLITETRKRGNKILIGLDWILMART